MKKKILFFVLILVLSLTLTGCLDNLTGDETDSGSDVVWKDYSNDYFAVKYPSKWSKITDDRDTSDGDVQLIVGNADTDDTSTAELSIDYEVEFSSGDQYYFSSKEEFYLFCEMMYSSSNIPDHMTIHSKGKTTIDECPAYKVVVTVEPAQENDLDYTVKVMEIRYYKNSGSNMIYYFAKEDKYSSTLANEMIDSIKFYK